MKHEEKKDVVLRDVETRNRNNPPMLPWLS